MKVKISYLLGAAGLLMLSSQGLSHKSGYSKPSPKPNQSSCKYKLLQPNEDPYKIKHSLAVEDSSLLRVHPQTGVRCQYQRKADLVYNRSYSVRDPIDHICENVKAGYEIRVSTVAPEGADESCVEQLSEVVSKELRSERRYATTKAEWAHLLYPKKPVNKTWGYIPGTCMWSAQGWSQSGTSDPFITITGRIKRRGCSASADPKLSIVESSRRHGSVAFYQANDEGIDRIPEESLRPGFDPTTDTYTFYANPLPQYDEGRKCASRIEVRPADDEDGNWVLRRSRQGPECSRTLPLILDRDLGQLLTVVDDSCGVSVYHFSNTNGLVSIYDFSESTELRSGCAVNPLGAGYVLKDGSRLHFGMK